MTRRSPLLVLLAVIVMLVVSSAANGQEATPGADELSTTESILRVEAADLGPEGITLIGFVRTTYAPGTAQQVVSSPDPMLIWVESGTLSVRAGEGAGAMVISDEGSGVAPSLSALDAGEEVSLEAGQAIILAAGGGAQLRNAGAVPSVAFNLLPSADVPPEPSAGVQQRLLARQEVSQPASSFTIELGRSIISPGQQFTVPPTAIDTIVVAVDQAQSFLLTRNNFNRGATPMDVYVLTITPGEDGVATPTT